MGEFHRDFVPEFLALTEIVQDEIAALAEKMRMIGPVMKRPATDTLKGSRFSNMKELRFGADNGVWRLAYAFDPARKAILLVVGDKSGVPQRRFYKSLIRKADERFAGHLEELMKARKKK
ncbi:MAG: type II toxin-antitoxin system RelE/ParE family toxin [Hyphomicrobiales bacterium]|nr:type II toxin-antitoxin system RelE/ParE family toxin [Hyphomicrobiales bacterium]